MLKVLDLFCGRKGFSRAFLERGHAVTTLDINPKSHPDICADVKHLPWRNVLHRWDVILASPVCTDFTKSSLPWYKDVVPSMELVVPTLTLIKRAEPVYWIIENVRGAIKWFAPTLGHYRQRAGSRYLWGNFPLFLVSHHNCYGKEKWGHYKNSAERKSVIPYDISRGLCEAIENRILPAAIV